MRNRWVCLILAAGMFLWGARVCPAQQEAGSRNVFLQTIGLLAGQGLVLGYTNLEGIAARYEKHQLPKDKTLTLLAAAQRYTELTLSAFSDHLMKSAAETPCPVTSPMTISAWAASSCANSRKSK